LISFINSGNLRNTLITNYANSSNEEKKSYSFPLEKLSSFHDSNEGQIADIEINETVKKNNDTVNCQF